MDALFTGAGLGASNGVELASSRVGLKLVSFTEEEIKTLVENTIFLERTIPADTYAGVAETHTVGGTTVMAVNDDVPDWVVYECVKAINEHVDELASVLAIGAESTAESTAASWANQDSMPVHPGTMAYLKDLGLAK